VPPATFPLVDGADDRPGTVRVAPTPGHRVWSLLPPVGSAEGGADQAATFAADDQLHLVDSAFEVGTFRSTTFDVRGVPHTWVHASEGGPIDLRRVEEDVRAIAVAASEVFDGELPLERYTFLCVGADRRTGGGGLEHRDGSVLMLPVLTDASDEGVRRTRSLVAHEYLHLWNVKRLIPTELVGLALDRPTHTTSLWVAEGWTAYYDDLLPTRAGLTSPRALLDQLRDDLRWVLRTPGAARQALVDSSWRAWTGLYVRDENSVNAGTSYYTHGAVVAAVLDLLVRRDAPDGDGLDDAFRLLWRRFGHPEPRGYPRTGYTHADVVAALSDAAGRDLGGVVADHVEGTEPPPLADLLDVVGCELVEQAPSTPRVQLGVQLEEDDRGPTVTAALRDGPAWRAGVTGGDRIVAIDGTVLRRDELGQVLGTLEPERPVVLTVERAHRVRELTVAPAAPLPELSIVPLDDPTAAQAEAFRRWSGVALADVTDGAD
jgi:predicted metalloprotease with PDZ domain